jgi:SCF-associated factor 1
MTTLLASRPQDIPALQHSNVIALAYGDYHYHALHANGKITSYGRDSQSCGSLGLSGPETGGRFRGLRRERPGMRTDAVLLPIANLRGRQVWFGREQKDWLDWMEQQIHHPDFVINGRPGHQIWDDDAIKQAAFSEWVEQEGRHWDEGPAAITPSTASETTKKESTGTDDYANLGAYFPIAIAAAGWHSGALVLVDEDKAHEVRSKWLTPVSASASGQEQLGEEGEEAQRPMPGAFESGPSGPSDADESESESYVWEKHGFPKVRLPDGFEMPGDGEPRVWRDGIPAMHELGLVT